MSRYNLFDSPFLRSINKSHGVIGAYYSVSYFDPALGSFMALVPWDGQTQYHMDDWLPEDIPVGDSFCGVDRSCFSVMRGITLDASRYSHPSVAVEAAALSIELLSGNRPRLAYGPRSFLDSLNVNPPITASTVKLNLNGVEITYIVDPTLQDIYLVDLDTWTLGMNLICTDPRSNGRVILDRSNKAIKAPTCECGAKAVNSDFHSSYCPLFKKL